MAKRITLAEREATEIIIPELEEKIGVGLHFPDWTDRDEAILRKYYGRVRIEHLMAYLNRSRSAVAHKAAELGLQYRRGKT